MSCPKCGFANPPNSARCQKCGSGLAVAPQQQQHAQPPQQQQYATPPQQQQPVQVIVQQQPVVPPQVPVFTVAPKSKSAAAALCFFLGLWGIHNFYLGYIGRGIAQLVLSISYFGLLITIPWVVIEFIRILTGGIKDPRGQPLV